MPEISVTWKKSPYYEYFGEFWGLQVVFLMNCSNAFQNAIIFE